MIAWQKSRNWDGRTHPPRQGEERQTSHTREFAPIPPAGFQKDGSKDPTHRPMRARLLRSVSRSELSRIGSFDLPALFYKFKQAGHGVDVPMLQGVMINFEHVGPSAPACF